jgi:hypothetical protein
MSTQTPASVEALIQKARELYPKSLLKIEYYGSGDSPDGDELRVTPVDGGDTIYIAEPDETLMDLARELEWQGGGDYNNEGGGGVITINTANLTCRRQEYNNIHSQHYEPAEEWQVW